MKTGTGQFAPFAAAQSRCRTARTRNHQNYLRILAAQPAEKKYVGSQALEIDACLQAVTV